MVPLTIGIRMYFLVYKFKEHAMKQTCKRLLQFSFVVTSLLVFPGCNPLDFFKGKAKEAVKNEQANGQANGQAIVTIDGKVVLTSQEFDTKLVQKLQSHPQTAQIPADSIPMVAKRQFLNELVRLSLINDVWGEKNKIEETPEFKKNLEEKIELLKESLVVEAFVNQLKGQISVTDAEVKADYAKNKDKYVKAPAAVNLTAISFDKKEAAVAFYDRAKAVPAEFNGVAKREKGGKFKEFGRVDQLSAQVPTEVRNAALGAGKSPRVSLVTGKDGNWVIYVTDKKDAVHYELAEISNDLKAMLEANKFREELEARIEDIKKDAKIEINEEFFKEKEQPGLPEGARILTAEQAAAEAAAQGGQDASVAEEAMGEEVAVEEADVTEGDAK